MMVCMVACMVACVLVCMVACVLLLSHLAAQVCVARSSLHFKYTLGVSGTSQHTLGVSLVLSTYPGGGSHLLDGQNGDVEGASSQVENQHLKTSKHSPSPHYTHPPPPPRW